MMGWPGKRGVDIPEHIFDQIHPVAHGLARQVWGTAASPHQLQWLYDNGHHQPEAVQGAFGALPHPHAPSVTVAEYGKYSKAKELYDEHQGKPGKSNGR